MSQILDREKKKLLCARLSRIEGQVRGLQRLIDEGADCEKVAQQMAAARKALDKAFFCHGGMHDRARRRVGRSCGRHAHPICLNHGPDPVV